MGNCLDLARDHLVWLRRWSGGLLNVRRNGSTGAEVVPYLLALLDLMVSADDQVLPCLGDHAGVVEIGGMIDEQAEIIVAGLVSVVVEELRSISKSCTRALSVY